MKQTLESAAINELFFSYACTSRSLSFEGLVYDRNAMLNMFRKGAEWHAKQSPWISVEERLPNKGQRVLVGFLYYYKYDDREAESRKHIDVFTYENGIWTTDSDISYLGKSVEKDDIKVICWMPIPSFDEILEANKDVLERIKEKGD
jgi:hypothetical protein